MSNKKPTVKYLIPHPGSHNNYYHRFSINSLAVSEHGSRLFTAGRDGCVRCWLTTKAKPTCVTVLEGHNDWVNDIVLLNDNRTVVSCSSDSTVRIWRTHQDSGVLSLSQHTDYAKALAYSPGSQAVASAGLDHQVYIWDVQAVMENFRSSSDDSQQDSEVISCAIREKDSPYSVAMNHEGSVLVTGSAGSVLRVYDPRSGTKHFKLRGHTENVRAVVTNREGTLCLSASSDATIKLWDIGQQRCVLSFDAHDDSVWSLAATQSFGHVISGGKDGNVFCTNLTTCESVLLCQEPNPVLKVLLAPDEKSLWVSTTSSSVNRWDFDIDALPEPNPESPRNSSRSGSYHRGLSLSPQQGGVQADEEPLSPIERSPAMTIPGRPHIVSHHILNNRREILTKDSDGNVTLWDVIGARVKESYGQIDFDEKVEELFEMVSVPSWFSVTATTGSLMVSLQSPRCFKAESYISEIDPTFPNDVRVNLGERVLRALYETWLQALDANKELEDSRHRDGTDSDISPPAARSAGSRGVSRQASTTTIDAGGGEGDEHDNLPTFTIAQDVPIIVTDEPTGFAVNRKISGMFDGLESENLVPVWVQDCLVGHKYPVDPQKIRFVLSPDPEDTLGEIPSAVLNASALLRVKQIKTYVEGRLNLTRPQDEQGQPVSAEEYMEISCNGKLLTNLMNLAAIKLYIWKSSENVKLLYRRKVEFRDKK